jgi:hypothetical protein
MKQELCIEDAMMKRSKKKIFRATTAVKSAARNVIGSPPATRQETPKTKKSQDKHKTTLGRLLSENE